MMHPFIKLVKVLTTGIGDQFSSIVIPGGQLLKVVLYLILQIAVQITLSCLVLLDACYISFGVVIYSMKILKY